MPGDSFDVTVTDAERAAVIRVLTQWRQQHQFKQQQQLQRQQQPIESDGTISDTNTSEGAITDDAIEYRDNSITAVSNSNSNSNSNKTVKACDSQSVQTRTAPDAATDSNNPFHSTPQASSIDNLSQSQVCMKEPTVLSSNSGSGSSGSISSSCSSSKNAQCGVSGKLH
jgi:hypothetical protein